VRRLTLTILALLLSLGLSGSASLVTGEPCGASESAGADADCPPACVTCGCCHQVVDVIVAMPVLSALSTARPQTEPLPSRSERTPRDILHVPRQTA
jgi:hypothetical protein